MKTCLLKDVRLMSSGKPAKHTAEMEADLEKAEGMIRLLFNDVQLLKDGRHLQAEQMYRRYKRNQALQTSWDLINLISQVFSFLITLNVKLVNLRTLHFKSMNVFFITCFCL